MEESNNVINLRQRKSDKKVATKAKDCFHYIQSHGQTLSEEEYKDFIMVVLADIIVLILKAGFYRDPVKALQELSAKVDAQAAEIEALKAKP